MAKKKRPKKDTDVNKSQAIRDHMVACPEDGPKAIAAALGKKGIRVSAAFVSVVKSTDKKKTHRSAKARSGDVMETMKVLESAKTLVDQLGGVDEAKTAIDAYGKLVGA